MLAGRQSPPGCQTGMSRIGKITIGTCTNEDIDYGKVRYTKVA